MPAALHAAGTPHVLAIRAIDTGTAEVFDAAVTFTIHLRHLPGLRYREVTVTLRGRRIDVIRGRQITAPIDLRGLPKGTYPVTITVTTTTGEKITGTRTCHTCAPKAISPKRPPRP